MTAASPQLERLTEVMAVLRRSCPWDREQTHRSLVPYLVEESLEVVEAIETADQAHLQEELGDLLLQVVFHAEIASEDPAGFDLDDVARGIADKLVARHPHVFGPSPGSGLGPDGDAPVPGQDPAQVLADLNVSWEQRKAVEKGRTSVLQGIPEQLSALSRATKIISRSRNRGVDLALPAVPIEAADLGAQMLALVARGQACGVDAEQAVRDAVRGLEAQVVAVEQRAGATRPGRIP